LSSIDRKKDHIELALNSQTKSGNLDLYYEPLLSAHPDDKTDISKIFLNKKFNTPLWISSMTGGTEKAQLINQNLAKVASEFGFGMGLGSCRPLLDSYKRKEDFDLRETIGDQAFYINLGVAQLEQLISRRELSKVKKIHDDLRADGLIIHVNPIQEWAQPEGDRFKNPPIETIKTIVKEMEINIIVKEVGQGFGPNSLISLMELPIAAIDFAGFGGTNFTLLELSRHNAQQNGKTHKNHNLKNIGHTCTEMINWVNQNIDQTSVNCREFIISGGVTDTLEGFKLQESLKANSIIGMASSFLKHAHDYEQLKEFTRSEVENYKLAKCFLKGK
jgi:isopentenyl-diphosphate delta-isomerase